MPDAPQADRELDLYSEIYRCESCSGFSAADGVAAFAGRGPKQTIPVSHFGDISRSLLWLVLNNPKGDRRDSAVRTSPLDFGASSRAALASDEISSVKAHFDNYFNEAHPVSDFFKPWMLLLDGLRLAGEGLAFAQGTICAVDLIKCPTSSGWMGYVMTAEGKQVWDKCLRDPLENRFLLRQVDLHLPRVLVFAGTQSCVPSNWRGKADRHLNATIRASSSTLIKTAWSLDSPRRISIGLASQRALDELDTSAVLAEKQRLQAVLDQWALRSS